MAQPVTKHHRPKTQFFSTLLGDLNTNDSAMRRAERGWAKSL